MANHSLLYVSTLTGIDGKTTGSTEIDTTSASLRFVPMFIQIEPTTATAVVVPSSISIGTNSPNYNDILAITALTGLTSSNIMLQLTPAALSSSLAASTGVFVKVTTGATATTFTLRVSILGFYF